MSLDRVQMRDEFLSNFMNGVSYKPVWEGEGLQELKGVCVIDTRVSSFGLGPDLEDYVHPHCQFEGLVLWDFVAIDRVKCLIIVKGVVDSLLYQSALFEDHHMVEALFIDKGRLDYRLVVPGWEHVHFGDKVGPVRKVIMFQVKFLLDLGSKQPSARLQNRAESCYCYFFVIFYLGQLELVIGVHIFIKQIGSIFLQIAVRVMIVIIFCLIDEFDVDVTHLLGGLVLVLD
jgi:hypothetical protein